MPPVRLGPKDLLHYDPAYGVIICRECQYAIQKSALQSHLLRHKIFRHERHNLLSLISQLDISEPEDVPLPPAASNPIEALPVISGFRCTVGACESLYASSKRMRRHQLEFHDVAEAEAECEEAVRPVSIQTFFRGTKIRYFEVATLAPNPLRTLETVSKSASRDDLRKMNSVQMHNESPSSAILAQSLAPALTPGIDMHHLGYFHQFLLETSLDLPLIDPKQSTLYWHHEFVAQALQQEWLMAGLLSLSACHRTILAHATSIAAAHHERSIDLFRAFVEGRKSYTETRAADHNLEIVTPSYLTNERGKPTPRKEVLNQLDSFIRCAHVLYSHRTTQSRTLEALITPIREFVPKGTVLRPDAFSRAAELMEVNEMDRDPVLSTLLDRIGSLPNRMAEPLGRPQSPEGLRPVMVALSAIAALVDSCVTGFEFDESTFCSMAAWIAGAGDEFHNMISCDDPAALIVLAHWAGSLLRRVEENGCWFMKGATDFILRKVSERLPQDQPAILELLEGL
ncbi:hypothetical protein N0V86_000061 [Didymella sp. IMI 355093]|nr:hypothetical protein N0V86_000061 [Didymella sp. IMI 355093]